MSKFFAALAFLVLATGGVLSGVRFLIPHSHLEIASQIPTDELFKNFVRLFFEKMIVALTADPSRRFAIHDVEFVRMYIEEDPAHREERIGGFKRLIASKQLEFVNGAMSEADTASVQPEDQWSNWFHGLQYLESTLGVKPTTLWQLHQMGQPMESLTVARSLGFTDVFLAGINRDVFYQLAGEKALQLQILLDDGQSITGHISLQMASPSSLKCDSDCDISTFRQTDFDRDYAEASNQYKFDTFWLVGGMSQWQAAESRFNFLQKVVKVPEVPKGIVLATPSEYIEYANSKKSEFPSKKIDIDIKKADGIAYNGHFNLANRLKQRITGFMRTFRAYKGYLIIESNRQTALGEMKKKVAEKLIEIGQRTGKLLHHNLLWGQTSPKVELEALKEIDTAEADLLSLLRLNKLDDAITCNFHDLESGTNDCADYIRLVARRGKIPFKILNPTLSKVNKLFRIAVPNDQHALKYYMAMGNKKVRSTMVCFRGATHCWLYFGLYLTSSYSTVDLELKASFSALPSRGLLTERVEPALLSLGADPIELHFSSFKMTIRKESLTIGHLANPKSKLTISLRYFAPKFCSPERLDYKDQLPQLLGEIQSYAVFKTMVIEGLVLQGNGFQLRVFQRPDAKHYSLELNIDEDKTTFECKDIFLAFDFSDPKSEKMRFLIDEAEVTGLPSDSIADSIRPVLKQLCAEDGEVGYCFFKEEARGVLMQNRQLLFGLTRKLAGRSENFIGKFVVHNYKTKDPYDIKMGDLENIKLKFATDFPLFFFKSLKTLRQSAGETRLRNQIDLPPSLRFSLEVISPGATLLRLENVSTQFTVNLVPKMIIDELFVDVVAFEVPNSTVFKTEVRQPVKPSYDLKPRQIVSILLVPGKKAGVLLAEK